jgi:hypothetical protein
MEGLYDKLLFIDCMMSLLRESPCAKCGLRSSDPSELVPIHPNPIRNGSEQKPLWSSGFRKGPARVRERKIFGLELVEPGGDEQPHRARWAQTNR